MTGNTGDAEPNPAQIGGAADLARFLDDWTALWRREMRAQANDPQANDSGGMKAGDPMATMELWRVAMTAWTDAFATQAFAGGTRDRDGAPRTEAVDAASDARDAEIERLARHVATLERRLADLERAGDPPVTPKRGPGRKTRK
jgi:hypothetical protein